MKTKNYTPRIAANDYLVLEDAEGSVGDLITIKTNTKTKKEVKEKIKTNNQNWMKNFPFLKDKNTKIDMAIVIYRKPGFIKRQDLDNIAKVILDVLKGELFYDDSQVVRLLLYKMDASLIKGYNTDSLVISFRIHKPNKQMILINKKEI